MSKCPIPHLYHPVCYAEDPEDLLSPIVADRPKYHGICEVCGIEVERDIPPRKKSDTTGYYTCYDCKREARNALDRERTKLRSAERALRRLQKV